jgi:CNT family concentrative nucleoside transporter
MSGNYIGILGMAVILGLALLLSTNRKKISLRVVGAAFGLQIVIAAFVLYLPWGKRTIEALSFGVQSVIDYSRAGIDMLFSPFLTGAHLTGDASGFSFAVYVLPVIIFFSALMSVLYHLKIMQWIVKLVGGALRKIIGTGPVESMNAAANVFIGQTEAPLVIRPYLSKITEPQLFAIMVSGVASIAGRPGTFRVERHTIHSP